MGGETASSPLGSSSYPPLTSSVRQARHFVQDHLADAHLEPLADDAGLVVAELASNAVLHARTDFDVRLGRTDEGVLLEVSDASPLLPVFTAPGETATSGRGLVLVQVLAARWGASALGSGKSVWCELAESAPAAPAEALSVDDLLSLWDDDEPGCGPVVTAPDTAVGRGAAEERVVLPLLPAAPLLAAKEHLDDLLRELQLVLLDRSEVTSPPQHDGLLVADQLDTAARSFAAVRNQVREQVSRAVSRGDGQVELDLDVRGTTAEQVGRFAAAVLDAERLSRSGLLLTGADDLPLHRAVRRRYLDALLSALTCAPGGPAPTRD